MKAEDDDHHSYIDGSEKREAPLHEIQPCQRFDGKADYNKYQYVEARQCSEVSIHIKPDCAGNIKDKYEDGDDDGTLMAIFGFCQG